MTAEARPPAVPGAGTGGLARTRGFLLVAALVLLSRLPFLGPGYGADPDSWRLAWAARTLATTGQYEASRFPGYPVQEIVCSWVWQGGPLALNGLTALLSAVGAGFFALALGRLGSRDGVLAALALAFTPAVFLASVTAMDYVWALCAAMAALDFALRGRPVAAGALAGLAIGCRITSAGFLPPLALALAGVTAAGSRGRSVAIFCATAIAVGALAFLPVWLAYGPGFLRFYQFGYPRALYVAKNASVDLWGVPGTLAIAVACVGLMLRRWRRPGDSSIPAEALSFRGPDPAGVARGPSLEAARAVAPAAALRDAPLAALCLCGIALYAIAYLRLPIKAFYLVPVVPFTLLLLGRLLSRRVFVAVCLALVASPWVLKVSEPGKPDSLERTAGTVPLFAAGRTWNLDLLRGPVLADHERRARGMRYVGASLERARRLPGESVVVAYDWLPQIRVRLGGKREGRVEYVYLLDAPALLDLRRRGAGVYDLAGAEAENVKVNGVSLREHGSRPLDDAR